MCLVNIRPCTLHYVHVCHSLFQIINIVEAPPTSPASSLVVPLAAGLGVALFLLVVVAVAMLLCVAVLYYKSHKTIKVEVGSVLIKLPLHFSSLTILKVTTNMINVINHTLLSTCCNCTLTL